MGWLAQDQRADVQKVPTDAAELAVGKPGALRGKVLKRRQLTSAFVALLLIRLFAARLKVVAGFKARRQYLESTVDLYR